MAKAAPGVIYLGINDQSGRVLTPTPLSVPDCLTHHHFLAERGDGLARITSGAALTNTYGKDSFKVSSAYYNHGTSYLKTAAANTAIMAQRLIPPGATKALLRLAIECIPSALPNYARNSDGSIQYSGTGASAAPVLDLIKPSINGHRLVLHVGVESWVGNAQQFGKASVLQSFRVGSTLGAGALTLGTYTDTSSGLPVDVVGTSTLYPITDQEVYSEGMFGNRVGMNITTPTVRDSDPFNLVFAENLLAYMYRFSLFERAPTSLTPTTTPTVLGDQTQDLVFTESALNPVSGDPVSFDQQIIAPYEVKVNGYIPEPPPFGRATVYTDSINALLDVLTQGETVPGADVTDVVIAGEGSYDSQAAAFGRPSQYGFADPANSGLLNLFSGMDWKGVPYFSIDVSQSANFGGVAMTSSVNVYASGGADGLVLKPNKTPDRQANALIFDSMVIDEFNNYGQGINQLLDMARYPIRGYWDPGLSQLGKEAMMQVIGLRPDAYVVLSTQSVYDWVGPTNVPANFQLMPPNSESTDLAIALSLKTGLQLYPESTVYNTPICRGMVIGQCGNYIGEVTAPQLPLSIDFLDKITGYMGSEIWKAGKAPDAPNSTNKMVTKVRNVNNTWNTPTGYDQSWTNGMMYAQFFDNVDLFYPAYPTVYTDDTSVLKSFFTMAACCSLQLVHFNVWKQLTPTGTMNDAQLITESELLVNQLVQNKYDGRFVIETDTLFTGQNEADGKSWTTNITLYANPSRDQVYSTVITQRMSALANGASGATA